MIVDLILRGVNRLQCWLAEAERRLVNQKYPIVKESSDMDKAFIKVYEEPIKELFRREGNKLRP